jgi:phosphoribosylamine--glycine ligase
LVRFARDERIDFVVVGPEQPLVSGLVDRLETAGIPAFGPNAAAARLEGSKAFLKAFCDRHDIPTAAYRRFARGELDQALGYIRSQGAPIVVKADGLAAGKGVTVAATVSEAESSATACLSQSAFGAAGHEIVVEECLLGEEASFFALVDGATVLPLAAAQDHKRAFDNDQGPNTGGMGAYSPAPVVTPAIERQVMERIIRPTVAGMAAEGHRFKGVLYAGLMITADGPKLLEYNVRFGDPEAQVLIVRLMSDLLPALVAARDGVLANFHLRWRPEAALTVVMATRGYPGEYPTGSAIGGVDEAEQVPGVTVFHAGTRRDEHGRLIAAGGRVLDVTATGSTLAEARTRAYAAVDRIRWPEGFCRRDIGHRALGR